MSSIPKEIFRTYDIRGVYPGRLNEGTMYRIGQAIPSMWKVKKMALGRDMRESGLTLFQALADGLMSRGVDVTDLGLVTTPMSYFAAWKLPVDMAGVVSASHNPKEYNGLKLTKDGGLPVHSEEIQELYRVATEKIEQAPVREGRLHRREIMDEWMDFLMSLIDARKVRPIKAVFDTGNGMAALEVEELLKRLSRLKATKMYFRLDGDFPNHIPNPLLSEATREIKKRVVKIGAEVGFIYDGDADRVLMIDEKGEEVSGSEIMAFLAKYFLKEKSHKKDPIMLYTRVMSRMVPEVIEKYGGRAHVVHVGHAFIKEKMREEKAILAGEASCHFYFKDSNYFDSGIVATVFLLEAMSADPRPLSVQLAEFRKYAKHEELSIMIDDREKFIEEMEKVFTRKAKSVERPEEISHRDGITFEYDNWWFNLRPSGTEPLVRLNVETFDKTKLEKKTREIVSAAKKLGGEVSHR